MRPLRLPARQESLPLFRQTALDEADRAGLDQATQQRVELVLEEALVNIFHHAYTRITPGDGPEPMVELLCGTDEDGVFRLTLTDWGTPFDPVATASAGQETVSLPEGLLPDQQIALHASLKGNLEADLEHRAPGGMGLFLLSTMSQLAYARLDEANVLTMRFPPSLKD